MKSEVNRLGMDEVEISIKNILICCLKKVKIAFLVGILLAIVLTVAMYLKGYVSYKTMDVNDGQPVDVTISESEKLIAQEYLLLTDQISELSRYIDNSLLCNMDYKNVYKTSMRYYVSATKRETVEDIVWALSEYVNDGDLAFEIVARNQDLSSFYMEDVIYTDNLEDEDVKSTINIYILAKTEEDSKQYVEEVKNLVKKYDQKLQTVIGYHELKIANEYTQVELVQEIFDTRVKTIDDLQSKMDTRSTLDATLSPAQKMYIAEVRGETQSNPNASIGIEKPSLSLKVFIVGFVLGFGAIVGIEVLRTIFSGRIQNQEEIYKRLKVYFCGMVYELPSSEIRKKVYRLTNGLKTEQEISKLESVTEYVSSTVKSENKNKLVILSTTNIRNLQSVKDLVDSLKTKSVECEVLDTITENAGALSKIDINAKVMMIEILNESKIKNIYELHGLCESMKLPISGYFCVSK